MRKILQKIFLLHFYLRSFFRNLRAKVGEVFTYAILKRPESVYVGVKIEFQENWNFPGNFIKGEIPS